MSQKFDFGMELKIRTFSLHMLLDHCYAFGLLLCPLGQKKNFFKKRTPRDLF